MSQSFNFSGSFEDFIRDLKHGIRDFARAMADEVRAHEGEFQDAFGPGFGNAGPCCGGEGSGFRFGGFGQPRYERYTDGNGALVFRFLLPGFDESCIDLSFRGDSMVLKATLPEYLRAKAEDGRRHPFLRDLERREYPVPADRYDHLAARAGFRNGILTVTIPAKEEDMGDAVRVDIIKEGN